MNIKEMALQAALAHAQSGDSVELLITRAQAIELYLNSTALTAGGVVSPQTGQLVEQAPAPLDDESINLLSAARDLTGDLTEMGFAEPDDTTEASIREKDKVRLKEFSEAIAGCDLSSAPALAVEGVDSRLMENFKIAFRHRGAQYTADLRPIQISLARGFTKSDLVINVSRGMGATTMIAAFAREMKAKGKKILVLTNTYGNAVMMQDMIDDAAVNVYDFNQLSTMTHAGESYDFIIIDNAAFIPYAIEDHIRNYIEACKQSHRDAALTLSTVVQGKREEDKLLRPTRVIMISVPGQERGWFYNLARSNHRDNDYFNITGDWFWSGMTADEAKRLKLEIGEKAFANQYENKFRPVAEIGA